ncbi:BspA family leucine-rich repeat surface protein [Lactobacillus mellis]|uniref:BspA family leucine-rich repeat surface protein n=1 Tax=Bombilactobacillus mellis TaxID=1218508 RepID=UPI001580A19D|nr:BspA family leucine-rich repeat surface protein [Bombilactobacillus mellis]NUG39617.1 BspA family leucine-rich repeat surface protein [Bombilactobacillus mellis]
MKKFVKIHYFLIRSLSAGQKFISLLLNYKVLSVQLGIFLGLLLINANYFACLNIKAATTSTLEEVINPSYLDMNSSTGSVQFNSPIKQVNTTSEIQVSAAPQLQQPNISPLIQVITVPSLLRSGSDYEKTGTDQPTSGPGWSFNFDNYTLTLNSGLAEPKTKQNQDGSWTTIWPWDNLRPQVKNVDIQSEIKVTNTSSMFAQMPQLSTINGLNNFTDKIEYMNSMFSGDSSLTSIDASQLKLDSVIQCAYMFDDCKQLKSLDVSNWNVGKVQNFLRMFAGCTVLKSITGLNNWDTTAATDMSSMFAYDRSLTELNLSNFDTSNVTTFTSMFNSCDKLDSITGLSQWNTEDATDMSSMFAYDFSLKELDFSSSNQKLKPSRFNTSPSNVTNFSSMFAGCTVLKSITGLNNWDTTAATDMSSMFASDENLPSLDLSKFDTSNVTTFNSMFAYDKALKTLDISGFTTPVATDMSYMFASNENLSSLNLSNFDTSKVTNFNAMFFYCTKLKSITGISNWKNSKATDMPSMFAYDTALETLDLSGFTTPAVQNMSSMFSKCTNLESITGLDKWNTKAATDMSSMFASDSSLQKLDLSSFDTRNATQDNFFSGDTNLWYLKIGKDTQLKDDCGLPEAPKDTPFPSNQELPMKYKTSQNGKWQKGTNTVVDKTGAFCWWYPNDEMYTADEIKKYSQKDRDNGELFIWQPAFNQSKGSLVLTVSPSQINFDIILDTNNNILGNNNKSSYLAEANSDLEYTVQNPKGESWQLYAMMTKFKKKSNSDSEINNGAMSLSLNEGSENGKQHPLNQQPTSIRTSADNSLEWALKPVLNINISGLNGIPKAGSSYTTTIDYDLVNSIQ